MSLYADAMGVGHCAWTIYYITRRMCCVVRKGEREGPSVRMNSGDAVTTDDINFSRGGNGVVRQTSDVTNTNTTAR